MSLIAVAAVAGHQVPPLGQRDPQGPEAEQRPAGLPVQLQAGRLWTGPFPLPHR